MCPRRERLQTAAGGQNLLRSSFCREEAKGCPWRGTMDQSPSVGCQGRAAAEARRDPRRRAAAFKPLTTSTETDIAPGQSRRPGERQQRGAHRPQAETDRRQDPPGNRGGAPSAGAELGSYGVCRDCGDRIAPARLEAIPWTRVCITCKQKQNCVTPPALGALLKEFHRDKLTMRERHVAVARYVSDYAFNNTYQYSSSRAKRCRSVGCETPSSTLAAVNRPRTCAEPVIQLSGKGLAAGRPLIAQDRDGAQAFVDKWRPRVAALSHARHRTHAAA